MKQTFKIRLPNDSDAQDILRQMSLHFEDKWEPETNELADGELVVTNPQRTWLGKYASPRRLGLYRSAFQCLRIIANDNRLRVTIKTGNVFGIIGVIIMTLAMWRTGYITDGVAGWDVVIRLLISLPFIIWPLWAFNWAIAGPVRKQIRKVIASCESKDTNAND